MVFSLNFDKDNIPEFLVMLEKQAPGTLKEVEPLVSLTEQLRLLIPKNDHMRAIQAQCDVAMEVYGGILSLIAMGNGLSAEALCRTLFEILIGTSHLAQNPGKLQDFIDYGKFQNYKLMRRVQPADPVFQDRQKKSLAANQAEYERLEQHFKQSKTRPTESWHGEKVMTLIEKSGMNEKMYHVYYRKVSHIAHGSPYTVVQRKDDLSTQWGLGVDRNVWNYYARTAYVTAFQLITLLLTNIDSELKLGFDKDLDRLVPIMNGMTERDIRARIKEIIQRETQASKA
jgi:hypothetical protein